MSMEKRKTIATALSGVLVGGLLLSGGLAFAGDVKSSVYDSITGKVPFFGQMMKHRGGMAPGKGMGDRAILSQTTLDQLVKDGTITQNKADEIKAYIDKTQKEREALREKMENMTLKEIRQYMQDNEGKLQNPLDQLVTDGLITQEQVDAFQKAMRIEAQKQNQQRISDRLKTLVDKGTITQEQSDKIVEKLEAVQKEHLALDEKMKDMTPEERRQYVQDNNIKLQDPISQLVADGTITQDQAEDIGKSLFGHKGFMGGHKGFKGGRR